MTVKNQLSSEDILALSYEEAVSKMEVLLAELESADVPLEQAIQQFELGTKLVKHCEGILSQTEQKIVGLSGKGDNLVGTPADQSMLHKPDLDSDIPF